MRFVEKSSLKPAFVEMEKNKKFSIYIFSILNKNIFFHFPIEFFSFVANEFVLSYGSVNRNVKILLDDSKHSVATDFSTNFLCRSTDNQLTQTKLVAKDIYQQKRFLAQFRRLVAVRMTNRTHCVCVMLKQILSE